MSIKIALAGNPNCGKTTLFNNLTGARQYVGNWPGVTVEKKEGILKGHKDVTIQDLPGIYSLSPYTLEEVVSRQYLVDEKPDAILNIVDGTNIERNLYLTTQLMELGIPVVLAVNMMDLVRKKGDSINIKKLSQELGIPVIEISALKNEATLEAAELVVKTVNAKKEFADPAIFEGETKKTIESIKELIAGKVDAKLAYWYAIKLFERDEKISEEERFLPLKQQLDTLISACEDHHDDDAESIVTNARYEYIGKIISGAVKKKAAKHEMTLSDKIDRIVTNRFLGLPIFVLVMMLIYAIAMGGANGDFGNNIGIGRMGTDLVNDFFEKTFINWSGSFLLDVLHLSENGILYGVIQNGIIAGAGSVLGFVPEIVVMFFLLAILEDIGYMSRVAFVMDRIFRQFGLSGKSFIPVLVGVGCGVPGIMATRTIENNRDRRLTVMVTTFIPCGAKMPIIGLIAGAIFGGNSYVALSAYFIGMASIVLSGIILKKFKAFAGEPAPFVMELPPYHIPSAVNVLRATWERGFSFVKRAGSIIILATTLIWFASNFGFVEGQFTYLSEENWESIVEEHEDLVPALAESMGVEEDEVNSMDASLLATVAQPVSTIFRPSGFGNWKPTVAAVTGLIAKENVVGTFGVLYNFQPESEDEELEENGDQIWENVAADFTPISAYAFLCFNLLCAPCFAAIGAIRREMNSAKWFWAAIGWMTIWAYAVSIMVYQLGSLFMGGAFGVGSVVAIILLIGLIYLLVRKGYVPDEGTRSETSVEAMKK